MQWLIGVGCVDPRLEQPRSQVLAGLAVAAQPEGFIGRLVPRVVARPAVLPGLDIPVLIRQHRKGRDDVLLEILVLVVAEHDDHVGPEFVERAPRLGKMPAEHLACPARSGSAEIVP